MFDPIPRLRTLSIMPTFQCTAECDHCGTYSSPRENTWLSKDLIFSSLREASKSDYKLVVFTGGEPLLAKQTLTEAIGFAKEHGLMTRVVTNAYWANSLGAARQVIALLKKNGLDEINFSTGDQHARFVPLKNIYIATRAALESCFPVSVMVETVLDRVVTKETVISSPEWIKIQSDFPEAKINIHESPWMPLEPSILFDYPLGIAINHKNVSSCSGCDSILSTTTIQANGIIGACCGLGMRMIPELHLGHVEEVTLDEADRRASDDFLKHWIKVEGPEKILAWASGHDDSILWENWYAHRCQACVRIYSDEKVRAIIEKYHTEKMADVLTQEWLLHEYRPEEVLEV